MKPTMRVARDVAVCLAIALVLAIAAAWLILEHWSIDDAPAPPPPPASTTTTSSSTTTSTTTTAPPTTTTVATTTTTTPTTPAPAPSRATDQVFLDLADCESGTWVEHDDGTITFVEGSAVWTVHDSVHQGGLQFAVSTWDAFRPAGYPADAHLATPAQQIHVARLVQAAQGWKAWPTCSRLIGVR